MLDNVGRKTHSRSIPLSLFADYIKERSNKDIIETDKGFATFFFIPQGCYIEDLYVKPEFRHEHVASDMADQIVSIAKQKNVNKLYGSILTTANHATDSLKVLLAYGFRLESAANNALIMVKDI